MKNENILHFSLLILVASMILGGSINPVLAQDDPAFYIENSNSCARNNIKNQI